MKKWTPLHEAPEPLEGNVVATITGGTIVWFVLFLAQLPFYNWFDDHDHLWWLWTCLAGAGLGLIGIWYVRRRDEAIRRHAAEAEAAATTPAPDAAAGGASADDAAAGGAPGDLEAPAVARPAGEAGATA
ncbi:DUF2530 domain-containing protein [Streptomyces buecherae]|uniref:DUF2530 domain-containing protein n=1 Tax=Streptomyces buecherae TaxID=2763006 RepID=A0A7H8N9R7_9ACTN|nr:DUF2530 domain-containing protein [Streptomyces buecherae]QKW50498.1 DUF2530 domain-containing protein [Streptomyces buecherae]